MSLQVSLKIRIRVLDFKNMAKRNCLTTRPYINMYPVLTDTEVLNTHC